MLIVWSRSMLREQLSDEQLLAREKFEQQSTSQQQKDSKIMTLAFNIMRRQGIICSSHSSIAVSVPDPTDDFPEKGNGSHLSVFGEPEVQAWSSVESASLPRSSSPKSSSGTYSVASSPSQNSQNFHISVKPPRYPSQKPVIKGDSFIAEGLDENGRWIFRDQHLSQSRQRKPISRVDRLRDETGNIVDEWKFDED